MPDDRRLMTDSLRAVAESIDVRAARRHILLCCDQTHPKYCEKDRGLVHDCL
jgi:hypothetical protein